MHTAECTRYLFCLGTECAGGLSGMGTFFLALCLASFVHLIHHMERIIKKLFYLCVLLISLLSSLTFHRFWLSTESRYGNAAHRAVIIFMRVYKYALRVKRPLGMNNNIYSNYVRFELNLMYFNMWLTYVRSVMT